MTINGPFSAFPPGFWRRIIVHPCAGGVVAGLEDDVHRFHLKLENDGSRITRLDTWELRVPYTTCPAAGTHLQEDLVGLDLDFVRSTDPRQHCTHLHDLAKVAAHHIKATSRRCYDIVVGDRIDEKCHAKLILDGVDLVEWQLDNTLIVGLAPWAGRDLRKLSSWKDEFDRETAFQLTLMRRGVFVSNARRSPPADRATDLGPQRLGACFTHHPDRAAQAMHAPTGRRDFSIGSAVPLEGFDAFAATA